MCRVALYIFRGPRPAGLRAVSLSFSLASQHDVVMERYRRGRRSHNHGWGLLYVERRFEEFSLCHHRSSLPLRSTELARVLRGLVGEGLDWGLLVLHSRLTGGEPINVLNSHPFHAALEGGGHLWLAHNGSVDKAALANELGLAQLQERYADSYFLTHWVARGMDEPTPEALLRSLRKIVERGLVKTALNIAAVVLGEQGSVGAVALNYVAPGASHLGDYYRLHELSPAPGATLVASSTVAYYMRKLTGAEGRPLANGEAVVVKAQGDEVAVERRPLA